MAELISVDEIALAVQNSLQDFSEEVAEATKKAVHETTEKCLQDIEELAPKRTGAYSKSWKAKKTFEDGANLK